MLDLKSSSVSPPPPPINQWDDASRVQTGSGFFIPLSSAESIFLSDMHPSLALLSLTKSRSTEAHCIIIMETDSSSVCFGNTDLPQSRAKIRHLFPCSNFVSAVYLYFDSQRNKNELFNIIFSLHGDIENFHVGDPVPVFRFC